MNLKEDDLTAYDLDFSVASIQSPKFCKSLVSDKDECCSCFKKKGSKWNPWWWDTVKPIAVLDPKELFNKKGKKKMRKLIGDVLEIPVTFVNSTIN